MFFFLYQFYLLAPFLWGKGAAFSFLVFLLAVPAEAALSYRFFEAPANRRVRRTLGARIRIRVPDRF